MKGKTFRYRFGNETKMLGIVPEFVLLRTDCFDLVQNLLSWTKYKCALSMGQIRDSRTNSDVLVSFLLGRNVCGTFAPLLF
jgi:hypothetical protein